MCGAVSACCSCALPLALPLLLLLLWVWLVGQAAQAFRDASRCDCIVDSLLIAWVAKEFPQVLNQLTAAVVQRTGGAAADTG